MNGLKDVSVVYGKPGEDKQPLRSDLVTEKNGMYEAKLPDLDPFTSYEFAISGKNSEGKNVSYTGIATTHGYPVEVIIITGDAPVISAKLLILGYEYTTDKDGKIYLELPSGEVSIKITFGDYFKEESIIVKEVSVGEDQKASEIQKFTFETGSADMTGSTNSLYWLLIIPVLIFIVFVLFLVLKRRKSKRDTQSWTPLTSNIRVDNSTSGGVAVSVPMAMSQGAMLSSQPLVENTNSISNQETAVVEPNISPDLQPEQLAPAIYPEVIDQEDQPAALESSQDDGSLEIDHSDSGSLHDEAVAIYPEQSAAQPTPMGQFPKAMGGPTDSPYDPQVESGGVQQESTQPTQAPSGDEPEDIFEEAARSNRFANLK